MWSARAAHIEPVQAFGLARCGPALGLRLPPCTLRPRVEIRSRRSCREGRSAARRTPRSSATPKRLHLVAVAPDYSIWECGIEAACRRIPIPARLPRIGEQLLQDLGQLRDVGAAAVLARTKSEAAGP